MSLSASCFVFDVIHQEEEVDHRIAEETICFFVQYRPSVLSFIVRARPPPSGPWSLSKCTCSSWRERLVHLRNGHPLNGHVRYYHKGQNPNQHEGHGDGDDGTNHGIVALIRPEQPAQATSDPVWRPAHVHHRGWGHSLLHRTQV